MGSVRTGLAFGKSGLRLLLAARKSRKGVGDSTDYERQDHKAREWAERQGHAVIHATADTISSQSAPWKRRNLGPWMTDPKKLDQYDAILVSDTDRISRGDDEDFHYIESWCYRNGKSILVADGPQFPPREGPMGESDRYQWIAQKRAARTYWESVRDKHADTHEVIRTNGAASGRPPFGYKIEGAKLRKRFVIDAVNGPIAREAFQRISDGRTISSVSAWLAEKTGQPWRVKRVADMIARTSYLGERDGHTFEALIPKELWESANAALAARLHPRGGRKVVHAYSSLVYCECGASLFHHQSVNARSEPSGQAKYRCSKGRRNVLGEGICGLPGIPYNRANEAIDAFMLEDHRPEWVMTTTGGDHGRQMELARLQSEMSAAMTRKDMDALTALAAKFAVVDKSPAEAIRTVPRKTGRTRAQAWETGSLEDRRSMLADITITVLMSPDGTIRPRLEDTP